MLQLSRKKTFFATSFILLIAGFGWAYYSWKYPYGWSHCCDKQLLSALLQYARDHDGFFPSSRKSPEASLSRLYPDYADANLLRGRTISLAVVEDALKMDGELSPETCGWFYVEGLRTDDDPNIAIFWDKVGLGHNGQRFSSGCHTVFFVGLQSSFIPNSKWDDFLAEQQKLVESQKAMRR